MKKPAAGRKRKRPAHFAGIRFGAVLGAVAVVAILIVSLAGTSTTSAQGQSTQKKYKGTRAFVVDKVSGEVRMPTQQEVDEVVANLSTLGQRPAESLPESTQANGAVALDLDGGFGGVLLGRPTGDGTWETRCVFTLEEGAEFLGLVVDDSAQ